MIHTQSAVTRGVVAVATSAMLRGVSTAVIGVLELSRWG